MRIIALQSGSNGNCIYLESGATRLLFDAGISGICASTRLAYFGIDIRTVDALFITHDHTDHVSGAGVFHRKFKIPVWMTEDTQAACAHKIGKVAAVQHFSANTRFQFKNLRIETISTTHDAADGVCFAVDDGEHRFGICTDLGCVFSALPDFIASLDGVLLESNFDPKMLESGPYPYDLKRRVQGDGGHLSNFEAAHLLQKKGQRLKKIVLGHISEENNTENLVVETHRKILGKSFQCELAHRYAASNIIDLND